MNAGQNAESGNSRGGRQRSERQRSEHRWQWHGGLLEPVVLGFVTLLALLAPLFLRVLKGNPLIPGTASYRHLLAEETLYDSILSSCSFLGDARVLLSVLLGLATILLLHKLLEPVRRRQERALILLLAIANPLFLNLFTRLDPYTVALPLALLCLLQSERSSTPLLLALVAVFSPLLALFTTLLLLLNASSGRQRRFAVYGLLLGLLLAFLAGTATPTFSFNPAIAEFGAFNGLSIFLLSLALLEASLDWFAKRTRGVMLLFLAATLLAPFSSAALIAAGFAAAPLAARLTDRLLRRRWTLAPARGITMLLLACGFLFLALTAFLAIADAPPSGGLRNELQRLPPGTVLAPPELGDAIEQLTHHTALLHDCGRQAALCDQTARFYASRSMDAAAAFLDENSLAYLVVTNEMRDGAVWSRDDEGLLFLLKHSERFTLVETGAEERIWRYTPRGAAASPEATP